MSIVVNSRVIIQDLEKRILLLKRASKVAFGMWNLPGGKVDPMQSINTTSRKEVLEESDLIVKNLDFLFYDEELGSKYDNKHYISFYLVAKGYGGNVTINHESSQYDWALPSELHNYDLAFGNDLAIRRFLTYNH